MCQILAYHISEPFCVYCIVSSWKDIKVSKFQNECIKSSFLPKYEKQQAEILTISGSYFGRNDDIKNSLWNLAGRFYFIIPCFGEKRVEGIISYSNCVIWGHLTIWMDPMFQAIELPGCIAHLAPSLAHMNGDHFSLESNQTKKAIMNLHILK